MGSRRTGNGVEKVYGAAQAWVERGLRADDSLFTPGEPVWTPENLAELRRRFLDRPDESGNGFYEKLRGQLAGSPPEVCQLIGEVLFVHFLIISHGGMRGDRKSEGINQVLGWSSSPTSIPADLVASLSPGIAHPGQYFLSSGRFYQIGFLIEFAEQLKALPAGEQDELLRDPWMFKDFAERLDFRSVSMSGAANRVRAQRYALYHLLFPDTFEGIVSADHKNRIANAFAEYVEQPTDDVDYKLQQIRPHLEQRYGSNIHLYEPVIRSRWDQSAPSPWDDFVRRAKAYVAGGNLGPDETDYKIVIAGRLAEARTAVLASSNDWSNLVKRGIGGNLINGIQQARFRDWIDGFPRDALVALQSIWEENDSPFTQRIQDFCKLMPRSAASGVGTRMNVISVLLMGLDPELYPPFLTTRFNHAYALTGYGRPEPEANEAALYENALEFLDTFISEASARGLKINHRLDAQGIVWSILLYSDIPDEEEDGEGEPEIDLAALARSIFLPDNFLEEINTLLEDKKQVIFQGPPGTGKTYVAQKLAEHIAGSKDRVTLVQFHPSYDYVDFVQGYRPALMDNGQPGFRLQDGPLVRAADQARTNPSVSHFLIVDEINRGNLAKVFGELYFLLEYRNEHINLQYSDAEFSLPENLYIIGTMNTADRSIALVDLALRRRFYFVEFHPADKGIGSVLRKYLAKNAPGMGWVADVVDTANEQLQKDEQGAAIGPSYFMKENLNEGDVEVRWRHSVMPYIRELLFGQDSRIADFELDKLRGLSTPGAGNEPGLESGISSDGNADGVPDA